MRRARGVTQTTTACDAVQALAEKVVNGITQEEEVTEFNGIHLRMEHDAMDWSNILGGKESYWAQYRDAMARAKFSMDTPLFVASGLLTGRPDINQTSSSSGDPQSMKEMQELVTDIVDNEVCNL